MPSYESYDFFLQKKKNSSYKHKVISCPMLTLHLYSVFISVENSDVQCDVTQLLLNAEEYYLSKFNDGSFNSIFFDLLRIICTIELEKW